MTTTTLSKRRNSRNLLLHACPRCHGDLLHDLQEDEFVCLQCSRRMSAERLAAMQQEAVLAAAA